VVCSKNNIASIKVIENNNGIFEKEILPDGETDLVYWICK
jgi:predicted acetyltransferase